MSDLETLRTLERVSRRRPRARALCCPACGGEVDLQDGVLWCIGHYDGDIRCEKQCLTLAELAVRA